MGLGQIDAILSRFQNNISGKKILMAMQIGDMPRFGNNFTTTIYGIAGIFEKVLRFLSVLLTYQKL
jgi:hypothetical protein